MLSFVFFTALIASTNAFGDRLVQSFPSFSPLAITFSELTDDWTTPQPQVCDPNRGIVFYRSKDGLPSENTPLGLGFTPAGQLASITINIDGTVPENLVKAGWWLLDDDDEPETEPSNSMPHLTVTLRENPCAEDETDGATGDVIRVNAGRPLNWNIPLQAEEARSNGYAKGACVKKMGIHYIHDITNPGGKPSWVYANLAPVVPMYDALSGEINGIFFTSGDVQQTVFSGKRGWDIVPLTGRLMCSNFCSEDCGWDEWFLSTMHLFFKDPTTFECTGECSTLSCCDIDANARKDSPSSAAFAPILSTVASFIAFYCLF